MTACPQPTLPFILRSIQLTRLSLSYTLTFTFFVSSVSHLSIMAATEKRQGIIGLARGLNGIPWSEEYEKMISGMM